MSVSGVATGVVVLGVGNVRMRDEGVGVRVADALSERVPPAVRILAVDPTDVIGSTSGPELDGASHVLVVDIIDVGRVPGTVVEFEDLTPCLALVSIRHPGLASRLILAGQHADAPEEIALIGVQPALVAPGDDLSEVVEAVVPHLVERATEVVLGWLGTGPSDPWAAGRTARPTGC